MYGIAQASTAYLITKITDPPPPPAASQGFVESQVSWNNKHDFMQLSLENLDKLNVTLKDEKLNMEGISATRAGGRKFS